MTKATILPKIEKLTPNMLEDVNKYIDYLLFINSDQIYKQLNNKRNGFGIAKGKIQINENFNEPINDIFEVLK